MSTPVKGTRNDKGTQKRVTPAELVSRHRREFLLAGAGATALAALLALPRAGSAPIAPKTAAADIGASRALGNGWQDAFRRIIGDAKPISGRITLDVPDQAENGNLVPYSVAVDSPMTDDNHVKAIHVLSTANPLPAIATFRLSPQSGLAIVSSRMRLAQTQQLIAVAELSDGHFLITRRDVQVAIGGCGV